MSGLGRTLADLELRSARAMSAAQERWDNMAPPEPEEGPADELEDLIEQCEALIGRAQRALFIGDLAAARDLLIEAGRDMADGAQEVDL